MDQPQQPADAVFSTAKAGVLLKTAREAQGLHIAALAVTLKVPVRKLEALEADRFDVLTDVVFTRALAASVCRVLKIDSVPVLAALPHSEIPRVKTDESGLNTPFHTGRFVFGQQLKSRLASPLGLAVVLLLLGILVVLMLPESNLTEVVPSLAQAVPEADVVRAVPAPAATPASALEVTGLPSSQAPSIVAQEIAAVPVDTPNAAPAILMLQSRGASWVEITDAQGVLQLRKILEPGEQVRAQGPLPLSVVLGRADDVDVSVRGQRLDVTAMSKANVARFEVK
jgi:cytoskeleton protein RodZ